jgi:hypothetical protein
MSDRSHSLPWLERLAIRVQGFGGYHSGAERRAADVALRAAIANRLEEAHQLVEAAAERCRACDALTEAASLERVGSHIRRVGQRIRDASAGFEPFYAARDFRPAKADALHAIDHALLEIAEEFVTLCDHQSPASDWVAHLESELNDMERKLDARAHLHKLAAE